MCFGKVLNSVFASFLPHLPMKETNTPENAVVILINTYKHLLGCEAKPISPQKQCQKLERLDKCHFKDLSPTFEPKKRNSSFFPSCSMEKKKQKQQTSLFFQRTAPVSEQQAFANPWARDEVLGNRGLCRWRQSDRGTKRCKNQKKKVGSVFVSPLFV